jgi:hypothetical protein
VGIVDPGWTGPIGTTLLNFSRSDYAIQPGDAFLRVSFFEHAPVSPNNMRKAPILVDYHKDMQQLAATKFPSTFLNSEDIAQSAGAAVLDRIRREALVWIGAIGIIFTMIQVGGRFVPPLASEVTVQAEITKAQFTRLEAELDALRTTVGALKQNSSSNP